MVYKCPHYFISISHISDHVSVVTLIFYLLYQQKNENFSSPVTSSVRTHSCVWLDRYWQMGLPLVMENVQHFSAYLSLKGFVKCTSGYSRHFIFLLFQVAFNPKQKPIRGLELSLAHCVAMVTGLRCSSSKFSFNELRSLCDPYLLNLDYCVPSMLASYLHTTIASKGGSLPALRLKHLNTNTTFSIFLTSHDEVYIKITDPFSSYSWGKQHFFLTSFNNVILSKFSSMHD